VCLPLRYFFAAARRREPEPDRPAQHDDIPELLTLACTIARWDSELVCAIRAGVTNARSESLNQIARLKAHLAHSFRNPANQRRQMRTTSQRRST
jgi:transposase